MLLWGPSPLIAIIPVLMAGCAARDPRNVMVKNLPTVNDESEVLVACPDDGLHAVTEDGRCVKPAPPAEAPEPCPHDGRHQRVNGICVDVLGK